LNKWPLTAAIYLGDDVSGGDEKLKEAVIPAAGSGGA
jgi:hypothetical protein